MSVMSVQQPGQQSCRKIQQDNERIEKPLVHATGAECRPPRPMSSTGAGQSDRQRDQFTTIARKSRCGGAMELVVNEVRLVDAVTSARSVHVGSVICCFHWTR